MCELPHDNAIALDAPFQRQVFLPPREAAEGEMAVLTLFGDLDSGNVHKVQMILRRADVPYRRVDCAQIRGEPMSPEFRRINPMGKVPTVLLDDGTTLSESGAILHYFSAATALWPESTRTQAEVLRWMFFEQYSHEPALAVIRYLKHYTDDAKAKARIPELEPKAHHALSVMEKRLAQAEWLACEKCTIADYALYPYTRVMAEAGIDPLGYSSINRWLSSVEQQPNFISMGHDGAVSTVTFSEYVSMPRPQTAW